MIRFIFPIILLLLSCTDPLYIDSDPFPPVDTVPHDTIIPVDSVPSCQKYGTATYKAYNFTGANTSLLLKYTGSVPDTVEIPTNSAYTLDSVKAGRTYLYIFSKFIQGGYGVYVKDVDTCQAFECAVRTFNKQIMIDL